MPLYGRHTQSSDLPRPVYNHPLPRRLLDRLPSHINYLGRGKFDGCFCWASSCSNRFYDRLARHPEFPKSEHERLRLLSRNHRRMFELRALVRFMTRRVNRINDGNLSNEELNLLRIVKDQLGECKRYGMPSSLSKLAEPLNQLFFNGYLQGVTYEWGQMSENTEAYTARSGELIVVNETMRDGRGYEYEDMSQRKLVERLFETLLHEQIHAFFYLYLCFGNCNGNTEQQDLCRFLGERMYWMYQHVVHKGQEVTLTDHDLLGHGPAFQSISRAMQLAVERLLRVPLYMGGIVAQCRCRGGQNECLSHCFRDVESEALLWAAHQ